MKINTKIQQMLNSRKGMGPLVIAMIMIAVVALSLVLVKSVSGGGIDSITPVSPGCEPKDIGVRIKGELDVADTAFWGVQPEPVKIDVSEVREYNILGVLTQDYEWEVCLINTRTNNKIDCDGGDMNHPGGDVVQHNPYTLDFSIPDNDCNGQIDDFDGKLVATVLEDGKEYTIQKTVSFREGSWQAN